MKVYLTFILLVTINFFSTAQTSKFDNLEDKIAIKPVLTLVNLNDTVFSFNVNITSFSTYEYSKHIRKQNDDFSIILSNPETIRHNFIVFSHKNLKRTFFQDFNIKYRHDELKRLLPRSLDPTYYNPCIAD